MNDRFNMGIQHRLIAHIILSRTNKRYDEAEPVNQITGLSELPPLRDQPRSGE